jgi:pyruvate dehydrogenase E1 component
VKAREILADRYDVAANVWSVTSYKELYRDGADADRHNLLNPGAGVRVPYLTECLQPHDGPVIAASDYVCALPDSVARWSPWEFASLGTDGFGRSDSRAMLRDFFEVDARYIVLATLSSLARRGSIDTAVVERAIGELDIDPSKADPMTGRREGKA